MATVQVVVAAAAEVPGDASPVCCASAGVSLRAAGAWIRSRLGVVGALSRKVLHGLRVPVIVRVQLLPQLQISTSYINTFVLPMQH